MFKCKFYNIEILDGYFSGVVYLFANERRYVLNIGYDIEFDNLKLFNCNDLAYNSANEEYSVDQISDIYIDYGHLIKEEIKYYIDIHGYLVFADK